MHRTREHLNAHYDLSSWEALQELVGDIKLRLKEQHGNQHLRVGLRILDALRVEIKAAKDRASQEHHECQRDARKEGHNASPIIVDAAEAEVSLPVALWDQSRHNWIKPLDNCEAESIEVEGPKGHTRDQIRVSQMPHEGHVDSLNHKSEEEGSKGRDGDLCNLN